MRSEFYGTEIFLDNEYTQEYLDICRRATKRNDELEYYEAHMVIPMDLWQFLPSAVKGKLSGAMPDDKKVYCKLKPEEHFRLHEILPHMFPGNTKQHAISKFGFTRIKQAQKNARDADEYGELQRSRNTGQDLTELEKYHPEWKIYRGRS